MLIKVAMSMKIAKRVSKSRPWGLNRCPHEMEPLNSTQSLARGDRTHRSDRLDALPPMSGRGITATFHCFERVPSDPNG
jgi:hypothetical protein